MFQGLHCKLFTIRGRFYLSESHVLISLCIPVYSLHKYKIECRVTIELLDTESDDTEKSVSYAQEWSSYVERYANPGASGSTGQNNGPSGVYGDNKAGSSSPMDTSSGDAATSTAVGTKCVNNDIAAVAKDSAASGKKAKAHSKDGEQSVSYSKSSDASSSSSGAPPSSTNIKSSSINNYNKARDGKIPSTSREFGGYSVESRQSSSLSLGLPVADGRSTGSFLPDSVVVVKKEFGGGGTGSSNNVSVLMKTNKCNKSKLMISETPTLSNDNCVKIEMDAKN